MRLAAIATAAGVPDGGFAGTVEHVYPRVCLLGLADQTLVTLATSAVGHLPRGITLELVGGIPESRGTRLRICRARWNPAFFGKHSFGRFASLAPLAMRPHQFAARH